MFDNYTEFETIKKTIFIFIIRPIIIIIITTFFSLLSLLLQLE